MKKYLLALILVSTSCALLADPQEVFGRSYMATRPAYYHVTMQQHLWHDVINTKKGSLKGAMQITPFYEKSIPLQKNARYFLPNGKCELLVSGDNNENDKKNRDIRAEWLCLPADFRGKFTVCPHQRQVGFVFEYNQSLKKLTDWSFFEHSWISIQTPIVSVENRLNFQQFEISNPNPQDDGPNDLCQAFSNPDWNYGKIFHGDKTETRLAEIRLTLGKTFMDSDYFQIGYYSTLVLPTGNEPDPEFLFAPVAGHAGHVGLGTGVNFQILLNRHPNKHGLAWTFFANVETLFLIRKKQLRTFDLCGKPWSRFMKYNRKDCTATNVPGVNVLTIESLVRPYNIAEGSLGWRVQTNGFNLEIGYSVFGRGQERVDLRSPIEAPVNKVCLGEFGIAGCGDMGAAAPGISASNSTLECKADNDNTQPGDENFVPVTSGEIDLYSARAGSAINHNVHVALGAQHFGVKISAFAGFCVYVDIPQKNSTLKTWGIWLKVGSNF